MNAIDQLIWDEAPARARTVAIIDAPELVGPALTLTDDVRVWCDDWRDAQRVDPNRRVDPDQLAGADLVLAHLPKSLNALDEQVSRVQGAGFRDTPDEITYIGGGRVKHMNRSMNDVLGRHFGRVSASLAQQKCRVLRATEPLGKPSVWPRHRHVQMLDLTVAAYGATFGGTKLDAGTRLLLEHLRVEGRDILDFGCGNGVISTVLARSGHTVSARDVSWSAVAATAATAAMNDVQIEVTWGDGLAGYADESFDTIVTNPPFHRGVAKESADTLAMFDDAASVLSPAGQLWCVFNSHLPWRRELGRRLGPTRLVAQNRSFTVTCTTKARR